MPTCFGLIAITPSPVALLPRVLLVVLALRLREFLLLLKPVLQVLMLSTATLSLVLSTAHTAPHRILNHEGLVASPFASGNSAKTCQDSKATVHSFFSSFDTYLHLNSWI